LQKADPESEMGRFLPMKLLKIETPGFGSPWGTLPTSLGQNASFRAAFAHKRGMPGSRIISNVLFLFSNWFRDAAEKSLHPAAKASVVHQFHLKTELELRQ